MFQAAKEIPWGRKSITTWRSQPGSSHVPRLQRQSQPAFALWCSWIPRPIFWCRFQGRRQLLEDSSSGCIRVTEGTGKRQLGIATAFTLWKKKQKSNLKYCEAFSLTIRYKMVPVFWIPDNGSQNVFSEHWRALQHRGICFKMTFHKMTVCRNGLGGSEGSRTPIIHSRSGTLSFLSAGSVTTLYSPAKGWANVYIGRFCRLFLGMPIFLQHLNWFLKCVTECLRCWWTKYTVNSSHPKYRSTYKTVLSFALSVC